MKIWHDWIKMHTACGVKTHVITGVEFTRARMHDAPYVKPLLAQTAKAGAFGAGGPAFTLCLETPC